MTHAIQFQLLHDQPRPKEERLPLALSITIIHNSILLKRNIRTRRSSFLHGPLRLPPELLRPFPPFIRLSAHIHHPLNCTPNVLSPHLVFRTRLLSQMRDALDPHPHARPQNLHDQFLVQKLLGKNRPRDHGHARRHALQRRIPPAVRQKPPDCRVGQDKHLWGPPSDKLRDPFLDLLRLVPTFNHENKRPAQKLQTQGQLDELRRRKPAQAPETGVHDRTGLLPVHPPNAFPRVDRGPIPSLGPVERAVVSKQGQRADAPNPARLQLPILVQVGSLELGERVGDHPVGPVLGLLHPLADRADVHGAGVEVPGQLQPRELDFVGKVRDGERLRRAHGCVDFRSVKSVHHELGEAAHAVEDDPRDSEAITRVGAGEGAEAGQSVVDGGSEFFDGVEEVGDEGVGREGVGALAAGREAGLLGGEGDGEEADREAGGDGPGDDGVETGGVERGDDDGDGDAVAGEELGHVDHGDYETQKANFEFDSCYSKVFHTHT
ncbi:myo-inositol polyphosphate 5-phosphatase 2 [Striga asiatica]|uniref:Myo-inositol polyphosphate 5-phosphatase 2 n=1 Tax=Striga asiatica TaxID=4170 RepID=A0A5A7QLU7_STRAF|nr:myo-inositol polyphosphate 5-phosphatase 2 [Striga asiatica]